MFILSPYDTTIGKPFFIQENLSNIRNSLGRDYPWIKVNDEDRTIFIYPNDIIKKFDHPLPIETVKGEYYIAVDLTAFVRENKEGTYIVANRSLYMLQTIRAALTAKVMEEGTRTIKSLPSGVIKTYCDMVVSSLSMAFNLNSEEILALRSISAWMYFSMLSEEEFIGEMEFQAIIAKLSRETNLPSVFLTRYIDNKTFNNVEEMIEAIKTKITNPSIQKLNLGLFYTVIAKNLNSSAWIGLEKQQMLAVSVEHIPTFVSILAMCLSEQVFKNAGLTKMALKNFSRDKAQFITHVASLVKE